MAKKLKFNKKQKEKVLTFLPTRFTYLEGLRKPLDDEILEEVKLYNDYDKNMQPYNKETKTGKFWWEQITTIPYIYTIIQTMVARLIQIFFGKQNYLKIYVEDKGYLKYEKEIEKWMQYELDKMKFKPRARDFLEDSLVQRTTWLHLIPVITGSKMTDVDFNVYQWFDVWFDTKAIEVEDTDFFIRDIVPFWKLKQNENLYMNLEEIENTMPPDQEIAKKQTYAVKNSKDEHLYYDPDTNNITDEVELLHWMGVYDVSKDKNKPDFKNVVFTWANRTVLIRAELVDLKTEKKILMFPIRPIRQANSLIGKSAVQVTKNLQYLLNEVAALTVHNFKLLVKLLFKYNKNGGIDLGELWAGAGNAVGYEDDADDVSVFDVPNMMQAGMAVISWIIQIMQQTTGAVDYVMGTSAGRGITETATGINRITQQAMFKFQMMAENADGDIREFVNFVIILWAKYNPKEVIRKFPKLEDFFNQTDKELEESRIIDIGMNDLTLRRETEKTQFLNGINIIAGLLEKVQGNVPELLREVMEKLEMENIDTILKGSKSPEEMQQMMAQAVQAATGGAAEQKRGGSNKANPQAENAATPEEEASNTTPASTENI